ncbi:pyrophosphatase [Desulfobacter hydrogenophilus]|uniref:DHH family phosphoesterase n=1 Tax=Desulfobacter hydrogenophilus TaxID=2291 RepID=A0A328FDY3_9BACT|nr:DHHA2 domain-containing protein [Desulfobacter hydrogenophilus]NDY71734.1 DHH family phosphoesterase [Desulfobacter hydrogenophilus]QBH13242.1 DHH family phosphoesterase [Desulfobacter hydrogenophilus]RAM02336.1 pyrophosphatase [Desulfobacter hydrogenophilus]
MEKNKTNPVNRFLSDARSRAHTHDIDMLVFGNEAADLDSVASAIGLAWVLESSKEPCSALPLIPIKRDDFRLKTESRWVLSQTGIDVANLFFLDDVQPFETLISRVKAFALVDHNRLTNGFSKYEEKVRLILDHHEDLKLYPNALRRIEPVGSCATLVGEDLINDCGGGAAGEIPPSLAALLLGTILIDTVNLDPNAGRVTPRDHAVAKHLKLIAGLDADKFYQGIRAAKSDISEMDTRDLLRRDCKTFQFNKVSCTVASVPLDLEQWMVRDMDLAKGIETYAGEVQADILMTMNTQRTPKFSRGIAVFCKSPILFTTISAMLAFNLDLEIISPPQGFEGGDVHFFRQGNLSLSRKKLEPILDQYVSKLKQPY